MKSDHDTKSYFFAVNLVPPGQNPHSDVPSAEVDCILYDEAGTVVDRETAGFQAQRMSGPFAFCSPESFFTCTCHAIRTIMERTALNPAKVHAISCSSHPTSLVLLDSSGKAVSDIIDWGAYTFEEEKHAILSVTSEDDLVRITGNRYVPDSFLAMLTWYRMQQPGLFREASLFLPCKDYLQMRLCGNAATDPTDAGYSQLLDIDSIAWSEELLFRFSIPSSMCPKIVPCGEVLGTLTPSAAAMCSLPESVLVIQGASNKGVVELTSMVTKDGEGAFTINRSSQLQIHSADPHADPTGCARLICSCIPSEYQLLLSCRCSCRSLNWYGSTFFPDRFEAPRSRGGHPYAILEELASGSPAGCGGVHFLPYLRGEDTPWFDDNARGVFFGISEKNTRADMTRAVFEGIGYSVLDILSYASSLDVHPQKLYYRFPGSIPLLEKTIADMTGNPVLGIHRGAPTLGLFMLMAVQAGIYTDLPEAIRALCDSHLLADPDPGLRENYQILHHLHRTLYPDMENAFHRLRDTQQRLKAFDH